MGTSMKELYEIKITFDRQYFKQLKKLNKMTNQDLSDETGIPVTTIGNYSRGRRIPNVCALYKIAMVLDVPMEDLMVEVNE